MTVAEKIVLGLASVQVLAVVSSILIVSIVLIYVAVKKHKEKKNK